MRLQFIKDFDLPSDLIPTATDRRNTFILIFHVRKLVIWKFNDTVKTTC